MVHPIFRCNDVLREVKVVEMSVGVNIVGVSDDERSLNSIRFLVTRVCVVEMRTGVVSVKGVAELRTEWNRTLSDVRHSVHELSAELPNAVPMNRRCYSLCFVREIDHDDVTFANVDRWTGKLEVDG